MIITYCRGHILRNKTVEEYMGAPATPRNYDCLPYVPKKFELVVNDSDEWYADQFALIHKLLDRKDVNLVVHFGDPDNEGELIVREVLGYCSNKHPVKRLWCNSMVPEVVAEAYYNLEDYNIRYDKYLEALARQQTDWLLGINVSRWLVKKSHQNFPAGRVLVPIVKFVYDKSKAYEEFVPTFSLGVNGKLTKGDYQTTLAISKPEISFEKDEKEAASNLCTEMNKSDKVVKSVTSKNKKLHPNKLFNLSSFQIAMSTQYGINIENSLALIQKLYEKGFVTYPRTSIEYLNQKEMPEVQKVITRLNALGHNLTFNNKSTVFNDEKCIGGHTALIVTSKIPTAKDMEAMTDGEKAAYFMILGRTASNFCECPIVNETKVVIDVNGYTYTLTGEEIVEKGFLEYEKRNIKKMLPEFSVGEKVNIEFSVVEKETSPPSRATEKDLLDFLKAPYSKEIKAMNEEDDKELYELMKTGATLGTESTTAVIVKNAKTYGYIAEKGKTLVITDKGIAFIKLLDELEINLYKERNIEMNKAMVAVGQKKYTLEENKNQIGEELADSFSKYEKTNITINVDTTTKIGKCPLCGSPVIEKQHSFQCVNKDCKFFINKNDGFFKRYGKTITTARAKMLLEKGYVKLDKLKSKSGNEYSILIKVKYSPDDFEPGNFPKYTTEFPAYKSKKGR